MRRRRFMGHLAMGLSAGLGFPSFLQAMPLRSRGKRQGVKKLVVLFQRGGNDGLNTLVPLDSTQHAYYMDLRPNLGFRQEDLLPVGDGFFGLHPAMAPLQTAIHAGHLCLLHAVGYPAPDRSHFQSQAFYETAMPGYPQQQGWLNRCLTQTTGPGTIRGLAMGYQSPQSMLGNASVPLSTNFGAIEIGDDSPELRIRDALSLIHDKTPPGGHEAVYGVGRDIFEMVDLFSARNLDDYADPSQPVHLEHGASYPDTELGLQLMHAAQMLKDDVQFLGVEIITVDHHSYDTHAQQIGGNGPNDASTWQWSLLADLAGGLSSFYTDMGPQRMQDVAVLVTTEFGRRAYENDSSGTDHGVGGVAMVLSGACSGAVLPNPDAWPGLDWPDLLDGDLNRAIDFRDIYWDILAGHMGLDASTLNLVIPDHTPMPLGLF